MNCPLFIARRISMAPGGHGNAPAVVTAIAAMALSVAVMLISIAVVAGFKDEIRNKIIGFNGHLTVFGADAAGNPGTELMTLSPALDSVLRQMPFIADYSLGISNPAVLKTDSEFKGVYMNGLGNEASARFLARNLEEGAVPAFSEDSCRNLAVISRTAANELGLAVGDRIDSYFIDGDLKVRRLKVAGIYNTHFSQYDDVLVFTSPSLLQGIARLEPSQGAFLEVRTDNFDSIPAYTLRLQDALDDAFLEGKLPGRMTVENVLAQGAGYFNWLSLLDTNVAVILTLMMIVGAFTLISGMLIIILERKRFIGLMKALGMPTSGIRQVFVWMALKIAVAGLLVGNGLALGLIALQRETHLFRLDPDAYYIDFVPVSIGPVAVVALNAGVLAVTWLVLILPSGFVSGISPSETMRSE